MSDAATCGTCGHEWPQDPALTVACPECEAPEGQRCRDLHPSGHSMSRGFSNLATWGHDARDLAAAAAGRYGCGCGVEPAEARRRLDHMRAAGESRWSRAAKTYPDARRAAPAETGTLDLFTEAMR